MLSFCSRLSTIENTYSSTFDKFCSSKYLGCGTFVIILGVIGTIFTIADFFRVLRGCKTLADDVCGRKNSRDGIIDPRFERDLKLVSSILGAEHYLFLVLGVFYNKPSFMLPWIGVQGFVILMETLLFFFKLICDGVYLYKGEVIVNAILLHNWIQVLCFYRNMTSQISNIL